MPRVLTVLPLLVAFALVVPSTASAATCTYTGPNMGSWTDPANWAGCGAFAPGAADTAVINLSIPSLSSSVSVGAVTMNGGGIAVSVGNTLTISGAFNATQGFLSGGGRITVGGLFDTGGTNANGMTISLTLVLNGEGRQDTSSLCIQAGGTVAINNLYSLATGVAAIAVNCGGGPIVIGPSGELRKTANGSVEIQAPVQNGGLVRTGSNTGLLLLSASSAASSSGDFVALAGTTLELAAPQTLTGSGSLEGFGTGVIRTSAAVTLAPTATLSTQQLSVRGSVLTLQGSTAQVQPLGTVDLNGGTLNSARANTATRLTVGNGGVSGSGTYTVSGAFDTGSTPTDQFAIASPVILNGLSTQDGSSLCVQPGGSVTINATFTIAPGVAPIAVSCPSGPIAVGPAGQLLKTAPGDITIQAPLNNNGITRVAVGTLLFNAASAASSGGLFVAETDTTLDLAAPQTITGGVQGNGTALIRTSADITLTATANLETQRLTVAAGILRLDGAATSSMDTFTLAGGTLNSTRALNAVNIPRASGSVTGLGSLTATGSFATGGSDLDQLSISGGSVVSLEGPSTQTSQICVDTGGKLSIFGLHSVLGGGFTCGGGRVEIQEGGELRKFSAGMTIINPTLVNRGRFSVPAVIGRIELNGPFINESGGITSVPADAVLGGSAIKEIPDGTLIADGTIEGGPVQLTGAGILRGSGHVHTLINDSGTVVPGASPGTLFIDGDYTQGAGGVLDIEIASTTPDSGHDVLAVAGAANLGGTVRVTHLGGFTPATSDTFQFVTSNSRTGTFATLTADPLPGGSAYELVYPAGSPFGARLGVNLPPVPANTSDPSITRTATSLTCEPGTWTETPTFSFTWLRDGAATGQTTQTIPLTSADAGHSFVCRVTATNAGGSAGENTAAVAIPAPSPAPPPGVTPTPTLTPAPTRSWPPSRRASSPAPLAYLPPDAA